MVQKLTAPPVAPIFVPGHKPELFCKAGASDTDAVIIDLEDAVPANRKADARLAVQQHSIEEKPVIVRVNATQYEDFEQDIFALKDIQCTGVMLAKAETPDALIRIRNVLPSVVLIPLVETALGLEHSRDLMGCEGVLCCAFGSLDFALDIGCEPTNNALLFARTRLVHESRVSGAFAPIDGVTMSLKDEALILEDTQHAKELGFSGKLAIHPKQVTVIQNAFYPSEEDIVWAKQIVAATEDDMGVTQLEQQMVDLPVIKRARKILSTC